MHPSSQSERSRSGEMRSSVSYLVLLCLVLFLAPSAVPSVEAQGLKFWKKKGQPADGTVIVLQGTLTDSAGRAMSGVEVVLQGARRAFSYREFRRADFNPLEATTATNEDGSFELSWTWHRYYNHFRLTAVFEVPQGRGTTQPVELAQTDLTERMRATSPVVVQLVADEESGVAEFDRVRAFEARLSSEDERRVYDEQGMPDQVDRVPGVEEQTWWFFDRGAAYRFREGAYVELNQFDPVRDVDDTEPR